MNKGYGLKLKMCFFKVSSEICAFPTAFDVWEPLLEPNKERGGGTGDETELRMKVHLMREEGE